MPYIKQENKDKFNEALKSLSGNVSNSGDLNYLFTKILHAYINEKGLNYENLSSAISALECAKLEFYRRVVSPYEDIKISENGDVCDIKMPTKN